MMNKDDLSGEQINRALSALETKYQQRKRGDLPDPNLVHGMRKKG
jgi:hypothetical protein